MFPMFYSIDFGLFLVENYQIWRLQKIKVESNLVQREILIGIFTVDEIAFLEYWKTC